MHLLVLRDYKQLMMFVMMTACMWLVIDMSDGGHLEGGERDIILHAVAVIASFVGDLPFMSVLFSMCFTTVMVISYSILMCPDIICDRCKSAHH
jgi:hypothetical protein